MTALDMVKDEAQKAGRQIGDELAEHILWEETGFPSFWDIPTDGATPEECLRKQVRAALAKYPEVK